MNTVINWILLGLFATSGILSGLTGEWQLALNDILLLMFLLTLVSAESVINTLEEFNESLLDCCNKYRDLINTIINLKEEEE